MGSQWHLFRLRGRAFLCSDSLGCYLLGVWSSRGPWQCECVFPIRLEIPISGYVTNQEYFFFQNRNKAVAIIKCLPCISHRISAWGPAPWPIRENCEVDIFCCRVLKNWPIYTVIGRPGGHRSCFVAMAPRCQAPSFVIDGVR